MVDWSKPLEAVHTDGRVGPAQYEGVANLGHTIRFDPMGQAGSFSWFVLPSGEVPGTGWTIRNVQPAWRTSAEQLDRMDALVRRMASSDIYGADYSEARAILAAREPVDPRFEKVRAAIAASHPALADITVARMVRDVLAALDAAE